MSSTEDLQAHARIRAAALRLFGEHGIRATTVRQIAEAAGVSPGLVIHHFGSKDGLRRACDEWMMEQLTATKTSAITGGDTAAAVFRTQNEFQPFFGYIAASVAEGGETAAELFEAMCGLSRNMFDVGVPNGILREPTDREATITLMVALSLGATMFEQQIARHLGGDTLLDAAVLRRYSLASTELFTHGVLADETMLSQLRDAFAQPTDEPPTAAKPADDTTPDEPPPAGPPPGDGVTDPDPPSRP